MADMLTMGSTTANPFKTAVQIIATSQSIFQTRLGAVRG